MSCATPSSVSRGPGRGSRRSPSIARGLIVDLFAGGGGASTGIRAALGRSPDVALNHDELAMEVHEANHPGTRHMPEDVWKTRPRTVTAGKPVALLWASPDCTHFSKAKGGKPKVKGIRALAHVVTEWAREVRPAVIIVENVAEFLEWGPLYEEGHPLEGHPIPERKGETFEQWRGTLELLGYAVEWRVLDASHYGAPTRRRRLFIIARCDGQPIHWPAATHGPGRLPYRTAAECIDWSLPCPSIFGRKRPLAEKTLWRIAEGVRRYVLENPRPFIVKVNHGSEWFRGQGLDRPLSTVTAQGNSSALVAPTLIQTGYGERVGQRARTLDLHQPMGTVVAQGTKQALVAAFLTKHFGGVVGHGVDQPASTITATDHHALTAATLVKLRGECHGADVAEPLPTVTASGTHIAEVRAFLMAYYGNGSQLQGLGSPLRTITAKHRLGLVTVDGVEHQIVDIGMRMLEPEELLRAQFGRFADEYDLRAAKSKAAKVRLIGNSVAPEVAEAVVRANFGDRVSERRAA
ncbi:DNA cytosine methyltransferase [Archangium violaceum]|uniref:DNA cytosine methyltransferase n=1 Tax=Archangium violaceum TaxID=83451 RepID=UPI00193C29D2|nr:DNA cytosine methyltransferase [Archangium violaceum]QRK08090.1 DNA cytosine methyltransferase [Archangium violaceum]